MATATFYATKEHSIAYTSGGLNVGTSKENHGPIGKGNSGWDWKELIKFGTLKTLSEWNGITQITNAKLKIKTTGEVHCTNDYATVRVRGLNGAFNATGGGSNDASDSWKTNADPVWPISSMGTTATMGSRTGSWANTTIYEIDITDYVEKVMSSAVLKRDGTPCDGDSNYGLTLDCNAEAGKSVEFKTMRGTYSPRIVVTGTVTPVPEPPTNLLPSGTQATVPTDADFSWDGDAQDESPLSWWDFRVVNAGNGASPDYFALSSSSYPYSLLSYGYDRGGSDHAALITVSDKTTGISGVDVSNPAGLIAWVQADANAAAADLDDFPAQGYWYAYQTRHENSDQVNGDWGPIQTFYVQPKPDVPTLVAPTASNAYVQTRNLATSLAAWTGSEGYGNLKFTYTHPAGLACSAYTIKFNGVEYTTNLISPSGGDGGDASYTFTVQSPTTMTRGTNYTFQVKTKDENGQWSDYSTVQNAKVQWAQRVIEHTYAAGSGNFELDYVFTGTGASLAVLYSHWDTSAWSTYSTDISDGLTATSTKLRVLFRFDTIAAATLPSVSSIVLSYLSASVSPDLWWGSSCDLILDENVRRYGKRSAKFTSTGTFAFCYPNYEGSHPSAGILVTAGETYTFSCFFRTVSALTGNPQLRIYNPAFTTLYANTDDCPNDTSGEWVRHSLTFTVPDGVTRIQPTIRYPSNIGESFWIDSVQLEEGEITSQWKPGGIGPAVSLDVGGVQVDGEKGGVLRVSAPNGDEFVNDAAGFEFSGNVAFAQGETYGVEIRGGASSTDGNVDVTGGGQLVLGANATYIRPRAHTLPWNDNAFELGRSDYMWQSVWATAPVVRTYDADAYPSGTTWTKPVNPDVTHILVECVGGGGGGGGIVNPTSGKATGATGGGGGGYAKKLWTAADLASISTLTITPGAGGSAGNSSGSDGGAGGASTVSGTGLTSVVGGGGSGGKGDTSATSGNSTNNGRGGGTGTGGDVNTTGVASDSHRIIGGVSINGSRGGGSIWGGGSLQYVNTYGRNGSGIGSGGGGANATGAESTGTNRVGGSGSDGIIVITEFFGS